LADFERLMRFKGRKPDAYRERGFLRLRQCEWKKAIADLDEAIRLRPDNADTWCHRAYCWIQLKEYDKAIKDADEALRLNPSLTYARRLRKQAEEANAPQRIQRNPEAPGILPRKNLGSGAAPVSQGQ
jgi:tetratricopeptide (TPR) repeat protein